MKGVYTATQKISALAAAKTLMYITAPSDRIVEILSATVTNESNATNFQFEAQLANVTTLGTPTATTVTPTPQEKGDQAAASTVKANVTASEPTYGSALHQEGAASLVGYRFEPPTELERIYIAPSQTVGLRMITTPTSFDCDVRITFREIG